jgi:SAM-dependent methyltransferase
MRIGPDGHKMRAFLYDLLDLSEVRALLDAGCGTGYDLRQLARRMPDGARLVGVDAGRDALARAATGVGDGGRCAFVLADLKRGLPFDDGAFDVVFSHNLLECIPDKPGFLREIHRVLRPGGQVLCAHWDLDSQTVDGADKALVRRIVQAYADWQQDWMDDCDGWMGRRLWRTFQGSGLFEGEVHPYVLTNTHYEPGWYGWESIQALSAMVRRGLIAADEYEAFRAEVAASAERGTFFYSMTTFVYAGRKKERIIGRG